ncbi:MAG: hypothetical protein K8S13_10675, partial [Desulfobacula sp.]|uniref:hypothetical protein n=1 Tax=Desulfobacula sp. TaxID=2593537 RepID=UPI0025BF1A3E
MKRLLFILLFISLVVPACLSAAPFSQPGKVDIFVPPGQVDLFSQTGIQLPDDLNTLKVGQTILGTVMDTERLARSGIKDTRVGDKVQLTLLEGGKL